MKNILRNCGVLAGLCVATESALCAVEKFSPDLEVSGALVQESTLIKDESDLPSESGDTAYTADINAGFTAQISKKIQISTRYGLGVQDYQTQDDYDLTTQLLASSASYDFDSFSMGLGGYIADIQLDNKSYLDVKQLSSSVSFLVGRRLFVRSELAVADQTYAQNAEKDSQRNNAHVKVFFLMDKLNHYVTLYYDGEEETAHNDVYSSTAEAVGTSWSKSLQVFKRPAKLFAKVERETRSFDGIAPVRDDRLMHIITEATVDLTRHSYLRFSYQHVANDSTQAVYEFTQNRGEIAFGFHW